MNHMQIVALDGKAGAGKDTVAHLLVDALMTRGRKARFMAFADPVRAALLAMGVPSSHIYNRDLKEVPIPGWGRSYRELAQTLGTEWGRELHGNEFWINRLADRVVNLGAAGHLPDVLIISDVRMQNEADWVLARRGLLVRVVRPGIADVRAHQSEDGIHGDRIELVNDGDMQQLRTKCQALCNVVLGHMSLARAGVPA